MCGILGAIATDGRPLDLEEGRFVSALDTIAHRGPDDSGVWWSDDRRVVLGHRRLSIIDLSSAGHQPMTNEDRTVWIVYNGEVYNFPDLRAELERAGHVFRSSTDTETIIHGYEEWGDGVVERLRGMFAFAIYDTRQRRIVLARDRVGIKPLYFARTSRGAVFGSEIKPLLKLPGVVHELNDGALREYLAFGKVHGPRTMFDGIEKLEAGTITTIESDGSAATRRYWTPYERRIEAPAGAGEEYYRGELLRLLEESVRLRMVSDVPVGVFLSGGVDSTANLALMSRISGGGVHTFTCGFAGQEAYDERAIARRAADHYGAHYDEVEITRGDLVGVLPELAWYLDEPVSDPTVIPIHFLSQLARRNGAIVILNGDGSDEVLCGYSKYLKYLKVHPYWRTYGRLPAGMRRLVSRAGARLGVNGVAGEILERSGRGAELYVGGTAALKEMPGFREAVDGGNRDVYAPINEEFARFSRMRTSDDYAEWLSYWGMRSEVEQIFLYRADRIGMASSIEIRVPFLDHRLVEFAMQMPQELKYRNGTAKYLLKKALEGTVPDEFLYRKKMGFCVPIREWAAGMMNDEIRAVFPRIAEHLGEHGRGLVESIEPALADGSDRLGGGVAWELYSLATWYRRWFG
jgi:asparagine synthase (glutamine-hydrolysing)